MEEEQGSQFLKIEELENEISNIQRSTKTSFSFAVPVHNDLRMKFRWYYKWHLNPLASFIHSFSFVIFSILTAVSFLYLFNSNNNIKTTSAASFNQWGNQSSWNDWTLNNLQVTSSNSISLISEAESDALLGEADFVFNPSSGEIVDWLSYTADEVLNNGIIKKEFSTDNILFSEDISAVADSEKLYIRLVFSKGEIKNTSPTLNSLSITYSRYPLSPDSLSLTYDNSIIGKDFQILKAGVFVDPDNDQFQSSQWQITKTSGDYSNKDNLVLDQTKTDGDETELRELKLNTPLDNGTYYARARYEDSKGAWSLWSKEFSFEISKTQEKNNTESSDPKTIVTKDITIKNLGTNPLIQKENELLAERTETTKTIDNQDKTKTLESYSGIIHYKEDYSNPTEQWKDINPDHSIDYPDYVLYDQMPSTVKVFKDKIGYEIESRKTGDKYTVELLDLDGNPKLSKTKSNNGLVAWADINTPDIREKKNQNKTFAKYLNSVLAEETPVISDDSNLKFEFEIGEYGVRLWKTIKGDDAPKNFKWNITKQEGTKDTETNDLKFRDNPEAFEVINGDIVKDDKGQDKPVQIEAKKIDGDMNSSFTWQETAPTTNMKIDTDVNYYPDADTETTSVDGMVAHFGDGPFSNVVNGSGSDYYDNVNPEYFNGVIAMPDGIYWGIRRSVFLFDTSSIPDDATITSGALSVYGYEKGQNFDISSNYAIYSTNPSSSTSLTASDYATFGSTALSESITYDSFSVSGYNDFTFNPSGISNINKTGISKFGARSNYDATVTAPVWPEGNNLSNYIFSYFAEQAGTSQDPKLSITYSVGSSIFGTFYDTDETTPLTSKSVAMRVNNGVEATATTDASAGAFTFSGVTASAGDTITIYSKDGTKKANTITVTDGSTNITGAHLYASHVAVRSDNSTNPLTILDMVDYDSTTDDTNMLYDAVDAAPDTLTVESGNEFFIFASETFTPGGTTTFDDVDLNGTFVPEANTVNVAGSWDATGGTLTKGTSTINFNDQDGSNNITTNAQQFYNVTVAGSNGVAGESANTGRTYASSGTVTYDSSDTLGWANAGTGEWYSTDMIKTEDGNYSYTDVPGGSYGFTSKAIWATNWGFNIPTDATIDGANIELYYRQYGDYGPLQFNAQLCTAANSSNMLGNVADGGMDDSGTYKWYSGIGGASNTLGASLTPAIVNSNGFGFAFNSTATNYNEMDQDIIYVDVVAMTIYYTTPSAPASSWTLQDALSVSNNLTVSSGTLTAGDNNITVGNNLVQSGGTFSAPTTSSNSLAISGTISKSDGTFTPNGANISIGTLTVATETWDFTGNNLTIGDYTQSGGSMTAGSTNPFNITGNFSYTSGTFANTTLTFTGTSSGKTITTNGLSLTNLTVNGSGGVWTLQDNITITGDITLMAGTLAAGNYTLNIGGTWLNNGGTFQKDTSTVNFNGSTAETITTNNQEFYNVTVAGAISPYALSSGQVAYWNMDESDSTTTVADATGNGVAGVSSASTNITTSGKYSNARTFDGTQYISVANKAGLNITADMSVSYWIKYTNGGTAISSYDATNGWKYLNRLDNFGGGSFDINTGGTWKSFALAAGKTPGNTNTWFHFAYTRSGSNGKIYINGTEQASVGTQSGSMPTGEPVHLMKRADGAYEQMTGTMDDARIYNRALTPTEVANIYSGTASASYSLSSNLTATNNLTISSGTLTAGNNNITAGNYIQSDGTFTAPGSSNTFTVNGGWNKSGGTFTHNSGTVTFTGDALIQGSTIFNNVTHTTVDKTITVTSGTTQTVAGTLTITGTSGHLITITSNNTSTYAFSLASTPNISYSNISYLTASGAGTPFCATYSSSTSNNNTGFSLNSGDSCFITISGTGYTGISGTLKAAINGSAIAQTTTAGTSWTISNVDIPSNGQSVIVFLDGATDVNETTAVTKYDGSGNITSMTLSQATLSIGSADNVTISNSDFGSYDSTDDEDILFTLATTTLTATADLTILASNTYSPDGDTNVAGSWTNNGTYTHNSHAVTFNGSIAGKTIATNGQGFYNLIFSESSVSFATSWLDSSGGGNATILDSNMINSPYCYTSCGLSFDYTGNYFPGLSAIPDSATITGIQVKTYDWSSSITHYDSGYFHYNGSNGTTFSSTYPGSPQGHWSTVYGSGSSLSGLSGLTGAQIKSSSFGYYYSMSHNSGQGNYVYLDTAQILVNYSAYNGATWSLTSDLAVDNNLTISKGTITAGNYNISTGGLIQTGGTFSAPITSSNYLAITNDIDVTAGTFTPNAADISIGTFNITNASESYNLGTNNLTVGAFNQSTGTLIAPGLSKSFSVTGSFANSGGTLTANSGTVTLAGSSSASTISGSGVTFNNLTLNGSGSTWTIGSTLTVANDITLTAGILSAGNYTINVAGSWTNNGGTFSKGTSTINFNGTAADNTITANNNDFYNVTVAGQVNEGGQSSVDYILPGTATEVSVSSWGATESWDTGTVNNIKTEDEVAATYNFSTADHMLKAIYATNFDFSLIPNTATIDGVQVLVNRKLEYNNYDAVLYYAQLTNGITEGSLIGDSNYVGNYWYSYYEAQEIGAVDSTWGASLTPAIVKSSGFGVAVNAQMQYGNDGSPDIGSIDYIKMKVTYTTQAANGTYTLQDGLTSSNNLTISSGTLTSGNNNITAGNVIQSGGTFTAPTGGTNTFTVNGGWNHSAGTFNNNGVTVEFTGDALIQGDTTFYNFTHGTVGKTITVQANTTQTIDGAMSINGTGSSNKITLVSSSPGTRWTLDLNGAAYVSWVTVSDSTSTAAVNAANSTEGIVGSTTNWFATANTPGSPTLAAVSSTSIRITINQNSNPSDTHYAIAVSPDGGSNWNYVKHADGTSQASEDWQTYSNWGGASGFVNTNLSINHQYVYKVKARNSINVETAFSTTANKYTKATTPGLSAYTGDYHETDGYHFDITINPNGNPDGTEYKLGYSIDNSMYYYSSELDWSADNTLVFKKDKDANDLTPNTRYWFLIYARNGEQVISNFNTGYNDYTPPAAPNNLATTNVTSSEISISWNVLAGAATYSVSYGTDTNATNLGITNNIATNSHTLSSLNPITTYYIKVSATSANGTGAYSSILSTATLEEEVTATYTINSASGSNGTISPFGETSVTEGNNQSFTITPSSGYYITDIIVDGAKFEGTINNPHTYTFINITANHTISVSFTPDNTCIWDGGGVDDNWNTDANWTGNSKPTANCDVIFNSTSDDNSTIDTNFVNHIKSLSVNTGYDGTITAANGLNNNGDFTINSGTFLAGSYTFNVGGNLTFLSSPTAQFSRGTSTIIFDATASGKTINTTHDLYNVVFNGTNGEWALQTYLITQNITVTNGTLIDNGQNVRVYGNIDISRGSEEIRALNSTGTWRQEASGNIRNSGGSVGTNPEDKINILQLAAGIVSTRTGNVYASKVVLETNAILNGADNLLLYNPSITDPIDMATGSNITGASTKIYPQDNTIYSQKTINITDNFYFYFGKSATLTMTGDFVVGNLYIHANHTANIEESANVLDTNNHNLTVNGTLTLGALNQGYLDKYHGKIKFSTGTHTITGDILSPQGSGLYSHGYIDLGSSNISVGGSMNLSYTTVTPGTSTVTMNATSSGKTITSAGQSINNLIFNGAGGEWTLQDNLNCGAITITEGRLIDNSKTLTINGNITINADHDSLTSTGTWIINKNASISNQGEENFSNNKVHILQIADNITATKTSIFKARKLVLGANALLTGGATFTGAMHLNDALDDPIVQGLGSNITGGMVLIYTSNSINQDSLNITGTVGIVHSSGGIVKMTGIWTLGNFLIYGQAANAEPVTLDTNGYDLNITGYLKVGFRNPGYSYYYPARVLFRDGTHTIGGDFAYYGVATEVHTVQYLDFGAANISVGGNIDLSDAIVTPGTSTVIMNATSSGKTITSAGQSFYNLVFNGVGGEWTLQDAVIAKSLTVSGGKLIDNGKTVTVNGDIKIEAVERGLTSTGTWVANANGIVYNKSLGSGSYPTTWSANKFYVLTVADGVSINLGPAYLNAALLTRKLILGNNSVIQGNGNTLSIIYPDINHFLEQGSGSNIESTTFRVYQPANTTLDQGSINITSTICLNYGTTSQLNMTGNWSVGSLYIHGSSSSNTESKSMLLNTNGYNLAVNGNLTFGTNSVDKPESYYGKLILNNGTHIVTGNVKANAGSYGTQGFLELGSSTLTVGGNFDANDISITPGTSTFNINDASKSSIISGNATFNNFSSVTPGKTINFAANSTQVINGNLTLTGSLANPILLRRYGGTAIDQWEINPVGTRSISYVNVSNSRNISGTLINPISSIDSGNNYNWFLPSAVMNINNNASKTNSLAVTLNITSSTATEMKISNTPDFLNASYETFSATKNWALSNGDGAKTVYLKVKDSAGNESNIISASIIYDTIATAGPTNLQAISGNNSISLSWINPIDSDFAKIAIFRSTDQNFVPIVSSNPAINNKIDDTSSSLLSTYIDDAVQNSVTYYYKIKAIDDADNYSVESNIASAKPDGDLPSTPQNLTITTRSNKIADIEYSKVRDNSLSFTASTDSNSGLKGYLISIGTKSNDSNIIDNVEFLASNLADPSKPTIKLSTLNNKLNALADGKYFARIQAKDNMGNLSAVSRELNFIIDTISPVVSGQINLTNSSSDAKYLSRIDWPNAVEVGSGLLGYIVYRNGTPLLNQDEFFTNILISKDSTPYFIDEIIPDIKHNYSIKVVDKALNESTTLESSIVIDSFVTDEDIAEPQEELNTNSAISNVLGGVATINKSISKTLNIPEEMVPAASSTAVVSISVATAAAAPLANAITLFSIPEYLRALLYSLFSLGIKRRRKKTGRIVEAGTDIPIPYARVNLIKINVPYPGAPETRIVAASTFTDKEGYFALFAEKGTYELDVKKDMYSIDNASSEYQVGAKIKIVDESDSLVSANIKLSMNSDEVIKKHHKLRLLELFERIFIYASLVFLAFGTVTMVSATLNDPNSANITFLLLYPLLWYLSIKALIKVSPFGDVVDKEKNNGVSLALIRIMGDNGKLIKTTVTDQKGKYKTLVPKGDYKLVVAKSGYSQKDTVSLSTKDRIGAISKRIKLESAK